RLRDGSLTSRDLTRAVLDRIRAVDPLLHAFEAVDEDGAMAAAAVADDEIAAGRYRGPLHGVPVVVKDIIDTAGLATTASSRLWRDRVPDRDAAVIERLRVAGAVIAAKTTTHEFAFGVTCPPTRTPWDLGR